MIGLDSIFAVIGKVVDFASSIFAKKNTDQMVSNAIQQDKANLNANLTKDVENKDVQKTRTDLSV